MRSGNVKVEQVNKDGNIYYDYDNSLSVSEIYSELRQCFSNIKKIKGYIYGEYSNIKYMIKIKNITYLGNPHPLFKKRIQVSDDLHNYYKKANDENCIPLLLGIYKREDITIFCDFNIDDYINKKAHNSSAHVYTSDISKAVMNNYFEKIDYYGNRIKVFPSYNVESFLRIKFGLDNSDSYKLRIAKILDQFFDNTKKEWHGIKCYTEMQADSFKDRNQAEWPAFYLEYKFDKYINHNNLFRFVEYLQEKYKGGTDLDLYFPEVSAYGDLKAHSIGSQGICGNDIHTIEKVLSDSTREQKIYYIVCCHETEKDMNHDYEVTMFWNRMLKKKNLLSYGKKMKNSVVLTEYYILEINNNNKIHLSIFHQGKNSNGKERNPKIMIDKNFISTFLVYHKKFS